MKSKITEERLISMAMGESQPTPNELLLLHEDSASRELLENYKQLFGDLRSIDMPELPAVEMQKILPGVREEISKRPFWKRWLDFLPVIGARGWSLAGAVATIFLFVFFPAYQLTSDPGFGLDIDQAAYLGVTATELYYADQSAENNSDLLYGLISEDSLIEAANSLYDQDTIYTQVAQLDTGEFESLTASLQEAFADDVR